MEVFATSVVTENPLGGQWASRNTKPQVMLIIFSLDVEIFDLVAGEVPRHINLQLPSCEPLVRLPYSVTFSLDLDLVIIDGVLYDLDGNAEYAEANILPPLPSSSSGPDVGMHAPVDEWLRLKPDISACNKYLIHLYAGDVDLQAHPELYLYRLEPRSSISVTRLYIPRNIDIRIAAFALTAWHPDLPVLSAITCELHDKSSSIELHLIISCYTLDLSKATSKWLKAEQTFSDDLSGMSQTDSHVK